MSVRSGRRAPATTNVLLIADTHLGVGQADRLLVKIADELHFVDVIVHAGDIVHDSVLEALARRAPQAEILAVKGNNDVDVDLPERLQADVDGCLIGVVHDSGPARGRTARLRRWFPSCDLVVFGHSHLPWHEVDVAADGHVQHHVNPGSAMLRRRAPACTAASVVIRDGDITHVRHVTLGCDYPAYDPTDRFNRNGWEAGVLMTEDEGSEESDVTTVASFATEGEAGVAQAKLRAYGVESAIDDQVEGGTVPVEGEDGVFVEVRTEDASDARDILDVAGDVEDGNR
jgi:uncharacterized protein